LFGIRPTPLHFDPDFKVNLGTEQSLKICTGLAADPFHPFTATTQQDGTVSVSFDEDRRPDSPQVRQLLELIDHDRGGVWELIAH
jgi:hypothetical protein